MPKGVQKGNKESKKPKKEAGPPKVAAGLNPIRAPITTVVPDRSKKK